MGERFSETAVQKALDSGHTNLPWQVPAPSGFLAGIDFDRVLADPNAKEIIRAMPVQPLYHAIKQRGIGESSGILEHLEQEQVLRMFDYDCWSKDLIEPQKAFVWLKAFAGISLQELYERFSQLDEEYQLCLLEGTLKVYSEEEVENLPVEVADRLFCMPCNKVFYEVLAETPEEQECIAQIIKAATEHNLRYAYALLAYSSSLPPNEAALTLERVRRARLEEDGFVSYQESQYFFATLDLVPLQARWLNGGAQGLVSEKGQAPFLDEVLAYAGKQSLSLDDQYNIHTGFLCLANGLCSVSHVEPDDVQGLNRILVQTKSLVSLGLEYLSQGVVSRGLEVLKVEHAKTLFRVGLTLVHELRRSLVVAFDRFYPAFHSVFKRYLEQRKFGSLQMLFDQEFLEVFGPEMTEVLKGLFNRYPMAPTANTTEGSNRVHQVVFAPLYSWDAFQKLVSYANGISGLLFWYREAGVELDDTTDKAVATALARAVLGHGFKVMPLGPDEVRTLETMEFATFSNKLDEVQVQLVTELVAERSQWQLSREADAACGADYASYLMKDHVMALLQAKKTPHGDLKGLLLLADFKKD